LECIPAFVHKKQKDCMFLSLCFYLLKGVSVLKACRIIPMIFICFIFAALPVLWAWEEDYLMKKDESMGNRKISFDIFLEAGTYGPESMSRNREIVGDDLTGGIGLGLTRSDFGLALSKRIWSDEIDFPAAGFYGSIYAGPGRADYDEYGRGKVQLDIETFDITARYYFKEQARPGFTPFLGIGGTNFNVEYTYISDRTAGITPITPGNSLFLNEYENLGDSLARGGPGNKGILTHDWADFTLSESNWGGHIDAGIEYSLSHKFSMNFFSRYYFGKMNLNMAPDLTGSLAGQRTEDREELDLSGFSWLFSLVFKFDPIKGLNKKAGSALDFLNEPDKESGASGHEHTQVYDSNRWFRK
jgi:outer membrane protein W